MNRLNVGLFIVSIWLSVLPAVCQTPYMTVSGCVWRLVNDYAIYTFAGGDATVWSSLDEAAKRCKAIGRPICTGVTYTNGRSDFTLRGSLNGLAILGQITYWMDCPGSAFRWTNTQVDVALLGFAAGDGTIYPSLAAAGARCESLGKACYGVTHTQGASDYTVRGTINTIHQDGQRSYWMNLATGCYDPYPNSFVGGVVAADTNTYSDTSQASAQCDQLGTSCVGVVKNAAGQVTLRSISGVTASPSGETAYVKCGCYRVYPNYFLGGVVGADTAYTTLEQAKYQCDNQHTACKGVVRDTYGQFFMRALNVLTPSRTHEIAYLKCDIPYSVAAGLTQQNEITKNPPNAQNVLSP